MKIINKQYHMWDYFYFPYKINAIYTSCVIFLKSIHALIPTIILWVTGVFVDGIVKRVEGKMESWQLVCCFLILLLLIGFKELITLLYSLMRHKFELVMQDKLALAILRKRASVKYELIENQETYERMERIQQDPAKKWIEGMYNILEMFAYVIEAAGILIIIAKYQVMISILVALLLVPFFILSLKNGEVEYEAYEDSSRSFIKAQYLKKLLSSKDTLEERYLFDFTSHINKLWHKQYNKAIEVEKKANRIIFTRVTLGNLAATFFSCCIIAVLIIPVVHSSMSVGIYMSLVKGVLDFVDSISWKFVQLILNIRKNTLYLEDFSVFACYPETSEVEEAAESFTNLQNRFSIEFKNVTFCYPDTNEPVIKDFSLKIENGKKYVLVGINGSGKSTLIKLLMKLYTDYEGEIFINDKNLHSINSSELRNYYSIVFQDYACYEMTVEDNILLSCINKKGNPEVNNKMNKIVGKMQLDKDINKLPQGMQSKLGKIEDEGIDISGGQWQKIAIARALMKEVPLYIFDEPTASLDPISECTFYELLLKAVENKTAIWITHRLGVAQLADEILVLDSGNIVERGNHKELMYLNGIYADMFGKQRGWYYEE